MSEPTAVEPVVLAASAPADVDLPAAVEPAGEPAHAAPEESVADEAATPLAPESLLPEGAYLQVG